MDIDLGDSGLDAAAQDTIEKTIEALSVIGSDELLAYFDDIGRSLQSILTDSLFDIDIPLTDLNVSDILDDMSNVLSSLPSNSISQQMRWDLVTTTPVSI